MSQVQTFARNEQNKLILNPRKLDAQFFQLVPDAPNNPVVVGIGATTGPMTFTVGQDGSFEAFYLSHHRRATIGLAESFQDVWVDIYDEGARRSLMNLPVHIDCCMGKTINAAAGRAGIGPHLLAESLFLNPQRALQMRFVNFGGGGAVGVDIFPVVHGTRFYNYASPSKQLAAAVEQRAARARVSSPYFFTTGMDIAALAAATQQNYQLAITGDGHFEWWKTTYVSDQDFMLTIFDQRNGRAFSNGAIYCRAGMGTASFPYILPEHTVLQANSRLTLQVLNLAPAATLTAYITLCGRRIYVG
jgi:hypothetical protein